jgi:hypothetical protein
LDKDKAVHATLNTGTHGNRVIAMTIDPTPVHGTNPQQIAAYVAALAQLNEQHGFTTSARQLRDLQTPEMIAELAGVEKVASSGTGDEEGSRGRRKG